MTRPLLVYMYAPMHRHTHRCDGRKDVILQEGQNTILAEGLLSPVSGSGRGFSKTTAVKTAPKELYLIPVS